MIDNLRPGGAQKALLAILRALGSMGAEPTVWCMGGTSEIEGEFDKLGVPVVHGPSGGVRTWMQPFSLFRYLRRERVALVQTFLFHADVTGRFVARCARVFGRGKGLPVIVSSVRATNVRHGWWQFALQRLTARMADAYTAVSRRTLDFAVAHEGVPAARATVIPNGIDVSRWNSPQDRDAVREELEIGADVFVAGTVGRLTEQKGHAHLLRAAKMVVAERPEALFLIAGYGPLRERLEAQARELGVERNVRFLGYRRDVARILAATDVFVLPSLWEGMSNAILEAMAAGKAVVASAVDGNVEQVVDGETGFLVPAGDADAVGAALLKLARDRARMEAMGRRGRERAALEFPIERMTTAHLDLYARLLAERAGIAPESWRG